jgi:hypothetical protein
MTRVLLQVPAYCRSAIDEQERYRFQRDNPGALTGGKFMNCIAQMRATLIHLKTSWHVFEAEHGSMDDILSKAAAVLNVMLCIQPSPLCPPQPLQNCASITHSVGFREGASSSTCEGHCVSACRPQKPPLITLLMRRALPMSGSGSTSIDCGHTGFCKTL